MWPGVSIYSFFLPSTMWLQEFHSGSKAQWQASLTTEPSHWYKTYFYKTMIYINTECVCHYFKIDFNI